MTNFKIGDIVECIDNIGVEYGLIVGKKYKIKYTRCSSVAARVSLWSGINFVGIDANDVIIEVRASRFKCGVSEEESLMLHGIV